MGVGLRQINACAAKYPVPLLVNFKKADIQGLVSL
jgi:hypothetical protein